MAELKIGPGADKIIAMKLKLGQPIPPELIVDPIPQSLMLFWSAFKRLSSGRVTMPDGRPASISWMEIEQYADHLGIEGILREELHTIVGCMDETYLDYIASISSKGDKRGGKGKAGSVPKGPQVRR